MVHNRFNGLLITCLGVFIITPDSLLIRLVEQDSLTIAFWRNFFAGTALISLYLAQYYWGRRVKKTTSSLIESLKIDSNNIWKVWLTLPLGSILFILGTNHNNVASNLAIIAAAPIFGIIINAFILKGRVKISTIIAIATVLAGLFIVVGGEVVGGNLMGSIFGLMAAFLLAVHFSILSKNTAMNVPLAVGVAAMITAVIVAPYASFTGLSGQDWFYLMINGFFVSGLSFLLTSIGAKIIAPEEVCLLFLLETLLGPILVWFVIAEVPPFTSLVGGGIIVGVVSIWMARQLIEARAPKL